MTPQLLLGVALCAIATTAANLLLRYGLQQVGGFGLGSGTVISLLFRLLGSAGFIGGLILYGLSALIWFRILSVGEVSSCYPVLVGLTFLMVTSGGVLLFSESIGVMKILGAVTILAGIILIAKS